MKITREVILDLWPGYIEGVASADTRALVESFLQQDPEFVQQVQEVDVESLLKHEAARLPANAEAQAMLRTKRSLRGWDWLYFLAVLFTSFAFGRIISDTSWDVSPKNFIITSSVASILWVSYFVKRFFVRRRLFEETSGNRGFRCPLN